MRFLKTVSGKILPALFWVLIMLAFDTAAMTILTLLAAGLHELGHIIAALVIGMGNVSLPRAALTGLRIMPTRMLSYKEEIILAAGGPAMNIAVFVLLLPFCKDSAYLFAFAIINLLTAVSNLIPIRGYDGYRIIGGVLAGRCPPEQIDGIMSALSLLFSAVTVFLSLLLMMKIGEGYWIFAIFFAVLLKEIFKRQKRIK